MRTKKKKEILIEEEGGGLFTQEDTGNLDFSEGDPAVLIPLFVGYMDQMNISEGPDEATVTISLENKLIDLEVTKTRRYTSEFAKQRDSGDKAFDYVNDLQNRTLNWGKE